MARPIDVEHQRAYLNARLGQQNGISKSAHLMPKAKLDNMVQEVRGSTGILTDDRLLPALILAGVVHAPLILLEAWRTGRLPIEVLARRLPAVWTVCQHPHDVIGNADWLELFHAVGYSVNGVPTQPPTGRVRLFRGAPWHRRHYWSWSTSIEVAHAFAYERSHHAAPKIWTINAPAEQLLALIVTPNSAVGSVKEYVLDTSGLLDRIHELTQADIDRHAVVRYR